MRVADGLGWFCLALVTLLSCGTLAHAQNDSDSNTTPPANYAEIVLADKPIAYWQFDAAGEAALASHAQCAAKLGVAKPVGRAVSVPGPLPDRFPLFAKDNKALEFFGDGGRRVVADPGEKSPLDFDRGDSITLEAWVNCTKLGEDQQVYIVGKGRTNNPGVAGENQNYALRLRGQKGQACISFLFRSADNRAKERNDFHRWNSKLGFPVKSGWHHIAVSYTFGESGSIRGYVDGKPTTGTWDYGGATEEAPVVDNDELWIGSSLGGSAGNTFTGQIDEVAIYRTALDEKRIAARWSAIAPKSYVTDPKLIPKDAFLVEVFEGVPNQTSWDFPFPDPTERYTQRALALLSARQKYTPQGVRGDRTNPFVLRVSGRVTLPEGTQQLLLRSRGSSRLFIDDKQVGFIPFTDRSGDGHQSVHAIDVHIVPGVRVLPIGDRETLVSLEGGKRDVLLTLEIFCGGRNRRPELGETLVAAIPGFQVPAFGAPVTLTDLAWPDYLAEYRQLDRERNQARRAEVSRDFTNYWEQRHAKAREQLRDYVGPVPPAVATKNSVHNPIDQFINAKLAAAGIEPLPLADPHALARRMALDTIGMVPTGERRLSLDELLEHPGWADHWTAYWQDVLAENPNIINPTLNNTGPFRWWIHESFEDNKPFDRFATELIMMEGSTYSGGPAGFAMASQNDAPMAAKAHVIAQAFLGMEMKCARCHDAPYHDFTQKQLFSLAAMLKRDIQQVPKTSTIPGDPDALKSLLVKVTLKPGEKIPPEWPFAKFIDGEDAVDLLQDKNDQRQRLAALVTSSANHRFAQVIVNRVWHRYFGRGIVEPVDDWEHPAPSHPELLEYLEVEFVRSGYDLKHLSRLILSSHTYQRQIDIAAVSDRDRAKLYAGQSRRRMSAEQVVDSLFAVANKPMHVEELNIDVDSGRNYDISINLGNPTRAWEFTSMSNERDRPSLSLPAAQNVIDVLEAFGWRATRPDPLTIRPGETNVLQSAILANGVVGKRISQLSDDSAFTQLALAAKDPQQLVSQVYQRVLTREPTTEERHVFVELLTPGFNERVVNKTAELRIPGPVKQTGVSWSNHLRPEANARKEQLKMELAAGDPVTARLDPAWRERMEDMVWTLINSPEFVLVP